MENKFPEFIKEDPIEKLGSFVEASMTEGTLRKKEINEPMPENLGAAANKNISNRERDLNEKMSADSFVNIFKLDLIEEDDLESRRLFGIAKGKNGILTKMLPEFQLSISDQPSLSNEDVELKMKTFYREKIAELSVSEKIKKVIAKACEKGPDEILSRDTTGKQEEYMKKGLLERRQLLLDNIFDKTKKEIEGFKAKGDEPIKPLEFYQRYLDGINTNGLNESEIVDLNAKSLDLKSRVNDVWNSRKRKDLLSYRKRRLEYAFSVWMERLEKLSPEKDELLPLGYYEKKVSDVKKDDFPAEELKMIDIEIMEVKKQVAKRWNLKKSEFDEFQKSHVEIWKKETVKFLTDALKIELLKKVQEGNIQNVLGKPILNADAYTMASIVGKGIIEDEQILKELLELKKQRKDFVLKDNYKKRIIDEVANADVSKLVFDVFVLNQIERETRLAKKEFEAGNLYQRKIREIDKEAEKSLIQEILVRIKNGNKIERDFLLSRKKDSGVALKWNHQDKIKNLANKEINEALFEDEPMSIPINFLGKGTEAMSDAIQPVDLSLEPKDGIIETVEPAITPEIVELESAVVETEKENTFEIPKEKQEIFENELLDAIRLITEIKGEDLENDHIQIEKHLTGNVKDKMESLLNKSGFINENSNSKEAEEYWKELGKLNEVAREIINLKGSDLFCAVHGEDTFFISKKTEIVGNLTVFEFLKQTDINALNAILEMQHNQDMEFIHENSQIEKIPAFELKKILHARLFDVALRTAKIRGLSLNDLEKESIENYIMQSLLQ